MSALPYLQRSRQLWVDGVGSYLLSLSETFSIGAVSHRPVLGGLRLLADLSAEHAWIVRQGEGYRITPVGPTAIDGTEVVEPVWLQDGQELQLGESVRLRFRRPTALSLSACLQFVSSHRPARSLDGVVLMAETCILGSRPSSHIYCRDWNCDVVLVRHGDGLRCQSSQRLELAGQPGHQVDQFPERTPVVGDDRRFMWEWYDG